MQRMLTYFVLGAGARVQGRVLVLGHKSGHRVPVLTPFLLVNSEDVLCFVLAARIMYQSGVWQGEM